MDVSQTSNPSQLTAPTRSEFPPLLPGGTIGLLGGGQLGRMFALEARRLGYRVHVFEPQPDSPAGQVGDLEVAAEFTDLDAIRRFASAVDVITYEFENIPVEAIHAASALCPVHPRAEVLHICQNREREKTFLRDNGIPCTDFRVVTNAAELATAVSDLGAPCILKTADFGYDGKGQIRIHADTDPATAWNDLDAPRGVLEAMVDFVCEFSLICARGRDGETSLFPVAENLHANGILDFTVVPARIPADSVREAESIVREIANRLGVVGLVTAEFFLARDGRVLVNELAPRPHNSGHYSFDACITSQFEQQLRAVCGLPLGSVDLVTPVAMANLLGDLWHNGTPDWNSVLANPKTKLHLYGKSTARAGRKMGHFCILGENPDAALTIAKSIRNSLTQPK